MKNIMITYFKHIMAEESKVIEVPAFGAPMRECDIDLVEMGRDTYEAGRPNWTLALLQSASLLDFAVNPVELRCVGCYVNANILNWIMASITNSKATADLDKCIFFSQNMIMADFVDNVIKIGMKDIAEELLSIFCEKNPYAQKVLVPCNIQWRSKGKQDRDRAVTLVFTKDDTDSKKILVSMIDPTKGPSTPDGNAIMKETIETIDSINESSTEIPDGTGIVEEMIKMLSNNPKMNGWKFEKFEEACAAIQVYEKKYRGFVEISVQYGENKIEPEEYCQTWRLITLVIMALLGNPKVTPKEIYTDIMDGPVKFEELVRTVSKCAVINSFEFGKPNPIFEREYICCPELPTPDDTTSP